MKLDRLMFFMLGCLLMVGVAGVCDPIPQGNRTPTPTVRLDWIHPKDSTDGFRLYYREPANESCNDQSDPLCFWSWFAEPQACWEEWDFANQRPAGSFFCQLADSDWPLQRGPDLIPGLEYEFCAVAYAGLDESETCTIAYDDINGNSVRDPGEGTIFCWPEWWDCDESGCVPVTVS